MVHNELNITNNEVRAMKTGLHTDNIAGMKRIYGINTTRIKLTPIWSIFIDEGLSAFNLYQIFAAVIWYFRNYFLYAVFILVMAIVSLFVTCWVHRTEQEKINTMAQLQKVNVFRMSPTGMVKTEMISEYLLPGDIFEVNQNEQIPCDAILIEGQCLIDEAALTGESVPMIKT
jgi:cation-transporting P-type ATPase 13A2